MYSMSSSPLVYSRAIPENKKECSARPSATKKIDRQRVKIAPDGLGSEVVASGKRRRVEWPKEPSQQLPKKQGSSQTPSCAIKLSVPKTHKREWDSALKSPKNHQTEESSYEPGDPKARFESLQDNLEFFRKKRKVGGSIRHDSSMQEREDPFSNLIEVTKHKKRKQEETEPMQSSDGHTKYCDNRPLELKKPQHSFTIQSRKDAPYMDWIRQGIKKAEGRVHSPFFSKLKKLDTVQFHNYYEGILCRVDYLKHYKSFEEMVTEEGVRNLVPHVYNEELSKKELIRKAVEVYERFPGSHRVRSLGALAIGVTYICEYFKGRSWVR